MRGTEPRPNDWRREAELRARRSSFLERVYLRRVAELERLELERRYWLVFVYVYFGLAGACFGAVLCATVAGDIWFAAVFAALALASLFLAIRLEEL